MTLSRGLKMVKETDILEMKMLRMEKKFRAIIDDLNNRINTLENDVKELEDYNLTWRTCR